MRRNPWLSGFLDHLADALVYVKGEWEGITGRYAVITVTPKTSALSLMPNL